MTCGKLTRREALRAGTAAFALPHLIPSHVLAAAGQPGANDRVQVGVIGAGSRIRADIGDSPNELRLTAIADCFLPKAPALAKWTAEKRPDLCPDAAKVAVHQDYREMFDKNKLDAVFVTTTTHARALCCIHAVQAGLDVYAEKPVTLTIEEGQVLVKAVRKHGRVLQVGTQARSMILDKWAYEFIRGGGLGKMQKVVANNFVGPLHRKPTAPQPVPQGMNWDMWCNQTELVPYDPGLHVNCGGWGGWQAYDGGGLSWGVTGWGTHAYDIVQASLGTDYTGPVEVWAVKPGDPLSPVTMRYANGVILEMKLPQGYGPAWGAIFIGEKGKIETNRNKCVSNPPELVADKPEANYRWGITTPHLQNWVDCMRTRKRPNADVEIAHRSHTLCHMVNVARDIGRRLRWDPEKEIFIGDDEANRHPSVTRPRRKGYELPELS